MSRFPESRYDYKRRMTTRFALAVCGAALLGFVAIAVASSGAKAQNNFPTAGGSRVDGAVIMCLDAGGNAIPGTAAGNCLGAGGGGGGGAITAALGSYAAGALSAGSLAAGAGVDGWDQTQGAKADAACGTDTGTCTQMALIKRQLQTLTSTLAAVQAPIPTQAPTVPIGAVGIKDSGGTNTAAVSAAGGVATNEIQMAGSTIIANPCRVNTPISKPISITTGTTTNIVTGTSAKKIYVCYLFLTSAAADNVALIEGTTGGTCGSGTAALVGGVTAANGLNFGANGGAAFGNGSDWVFQTQTNNNDICIITSAATPLAGVIKYVVQ